jgi:hypothetical protein
MTRVASVALAILLAVSAAIAPSPAMAAKSYRNCAALNKTYPHGVGRPGARDKIGGRYRPGRSVTTFTRNRAVYNANTARDRDKDGVACEKR